MEIKINQDERGKYIEVFKMPGTGQVSYAISKPGAVRGNHYHKRKREKFCVIEGKAKITLRDRNDKDGSAKEFYSSGEKLEIIEIEPNWTHSIKNIGESELKLLIWANEVFDPKNTDTYAEQV